MKDKSIAFEILRGREGLESLERAWQSIPTESVSSFLHFPEWYTAHYDRSGDPIVVIGRRFEEIVFAGVFELSIVKQAGFSLRILNLAYPNEMGVSDLLCVRGCPPLVELQLALKRAGLRYHLLRYWGVSAQSNAFGMIKDDSSATIKLSHFSKYIDLRNGADAFFSQFSKKFARNLKRKRNKAQAIDELSLRRFYGDEAEEAYHEFLRIEDSGWKGRSATSILKQPEKKRFYDRLFCAYRTAGVININLLYLGDVCIAGQFAVLCGRTLSLLKIAFNEEYASISPGDLILEELITLDRQHSDVDFLSFVTGVNWIDKWNPLTEPVYVCYLGSNKCISFLIGWGMQVRSTFQKLMTRFKSD